jgi:hypothetical protein
MKKSVVFLAHFARFGFLAARHKAKYGKENNAFLHMC